MTEHMVTTDHVEYASKNLEATRKLLENVLGFHFNIMASMRDYSLRSDTLPTGAGTGVRQLEPGESPNTSAYLTVTNLDETLQAAEREGAKVVVPKTEVPTLGWRAVVQVPGDVLIGLFQPLPGRPRS